MKADRRLVKEIENFFPLEARSAISMIKANPRKREWITWSSSLE
ncbi:MAG: hypothetical protein ACETWK_09455 [Candidatus Aminicenantaceae bacterium]